VLKGDIPPGDNECRFDYNKLESALKAIVKRKLNREDAIMADSNIRTARTFILFNDGTPLRVARVCRSYPCDGNDPDMWSIWQAGRATTAAPELFKPPHIFGAPGVTFSNPGEIALTEASRIWTNIKRSCLVSIGTGNPMRSPDPHQTGEPVSFKGPTWIPSVDNNNPIRSLREAMVIKEHCGDLARVSMVTHSRLLQLSISMASERPFSYYRFNIQGILTLEEGNRVVLTLLTTNYMREERRAGALTRCVQDLIDTSKSSQLT
jgi:hypothetical protein